MADDQGAWRGMFVADDSLGRARVVNGKFSCISVVPAEPPIVVAVLLSKRAVQTGVTTLELTGQRPPHLVSWIRQRLDAAVLGVG